jgi:RNA polymerase sigma factor (sigma-70 family)
MVLRAARNDTTRAHEALAHLCETYWYPLYAYVRRRGYNPHDAQDLTQEFFARLLQKDFLSSASQEKGRFRSFLLVVLKRFLSNEWDKVRAQKRGGGQVVQQLDTELAERLYATEAAGDLPPDRIYERRWALTMLDRAMSRLREEFSVEAKGAHFEVLKGYLTADRGEIPYAEVAGQLGLNEAAARMAVHRLRRRFRSLFREEIAQTVAEPADIEDEIRYLLRALAN